MSPFESLLALDKFFAEEEAKLAPKRKEFLQLLDECFGATIILNTLSREERTVFVSNQTMLLHRCKVGQYWYCAPNKARLRIK